MLELGLKERLSREPGIMSFAYPYVRLWNQINEGDVIENWSSFTQESSKGVLYINIPFCLKKCGYCDYSSNYGIEDRHDDYVNYVDAIEKEIKLYSSFLTNIKFEAVYFGGGTPNIFCEKGSKRLIDKVLSDLPITKEAEVSIEVYPWKKMLRDKLNLYKDIGINRVSVGVQDFDDEVISFTGRKYTGKEAIDIVEEAKNLFRTVNIDLICGLPKQTKWKETLETTLKLNPSQITLQPFSNRHPGIKFNLPNYKETLPSLKSMIEMYDFACHMLKEANYTQTSRHQFILEGEHKYEEMITNSALRLGIGAHSISLLPGLTYKNFTSLEDYKKALKEGVLPIEKGFELKGKEKARSYLFYSLSADCGRLVLDEKDFEEKFGQKIQKMFQNEVKALEKEGLIILEKDKIILTKKGTYFTSVLQRTFYNPEFIKRKEKIYIK